MYIPNLVRNKENFNEVVIYENNILAGIIYTYLTSAMLLHEIEMLVLKKNFTGYRALSILKYYGLRDVHKGLFIDKSIEEIISTFKKLMIEDSQYADIYEVLSTVNYSFLKSLQFKMLNHIDDFQTDKAITEIEKVTNQKLDLSNKEIEAYYNALCKIRNNKVQSSFRAKLLEEFGFKCAICEINKPDLLIASHIIPYSRCQNDVTIAGDHNNGLLLCPTHDALFELGNYISFSIDGDILISNVLEKSIYPSLNLNEKMKLEKKFLTDRRIEFLEYHKRFLALKESI